MTVTTTEGTTNPGVSENTPVAKSVDDVAALFLDRWKDGESPSDHDEGTTAEEEEETTNSDAETDEPEDSDDESDDESSEDDSDTDQEDTEEAEETATNEKKVAPDDAVVKIKVGDEERVVPVKDLSRLYGQEASLTKKSQELATKRKEVDDLGAKHVLGLNALIEKAQAEFKPYAEIDFWVASKELSTEEFSALRANALAAKEKLDFLTSELDSTLTTHQERQKVAHKEAAQEAQKVLSAKDWWNQDNYNALRTYAVTQGLDASEVNQYVNPVVIEMIYKAMQHDNTKKAAKTKKVATAPKKVLKPSSSAIENVASSKPKLDKAKLRSSDNNDVADAILARWSK